MGIVVSFSYLAAFPVFFIYGAYMAKAPRINVVVTEDLVERLHKMMDRSGIPASALVRRALDGYLTHLERNSKDNGAVVVEDANNVNWK